MLSQERTTRAVGGNGGLYETQIRMTCIRVTASIAATAGVQ